MYLGTQVAPRDDQRLPDVGAAWRAPCLRRSAGQPAPLEPGDLHRPARAHRKLRADAGHGAASLASRPIEQGQSPNILLGREPDRQREIDSICALIERLAQAGIPAAKYNLNIIGIPRTGQEPGRGGSRNAAFRWDKADHDAPPGLAGVVDEDENWARIDHFLRHVVPVATLRGCGWPAIRTTPTRRRATRV